jgi:hypothetical protein
MGEDASRNANELDSAVGGSARKTDQSRKLGDPARRRGSSTNAERESITSSRLWSGIGEVHSSKEAA